MGGSPRSDRLGGQPVLPRLVQPGPRIYRYISGDDKYERPFEVTGYGDQVFEWDQHGIAALLERQYRERPEGPQCENTKIWFPCNASAGLGMYLYDRIHGRATHRPVEGWLEYARENFLGVGSDGRLEWVTSYYDPIVNHKANGGPGAGVGTAFLLLPQDRELARSSTNRRPTPWAGTTPASKSARRSPAW